MKVTFKPNTDDVSGAPSQVIYPMLQSRGARLRAHDPQGCHKAHASLPGVEWCESALEVAEGADVLVILTEWSEFRAFDLKSAREGRFAAMYILKSWRRKQDTCINKGIGRTKPPAVDLRVTFAEGH